MDGFGSRGIRMVIAACLLAAASTPALAATASPQVAKEIVGLTQELMDALGAGKAQAWQRILADDVLITDEFGRRQTKQEAVDGIHAFPSGMSGSIELRDAKVRSYGETAVIDCEAYEQEVVFGQKLVVRYLFTSTYVRRDGNWKLVAMQDVTLPTPPPALPVRDIVAGDYVGTYRYGPERAFIVAVEDGRLMFRTRTTGTPHALDAIAKDVFMGADDERNLLIFRRDAAGRVSELIERRKFNDLRMEREAGK